MFLPPPPVIQYIIFVGFQGSVLTFQMHKNILDNCTVPGNGRPEKTKKNSISNSPHFPHCGLFYKHCSHERSLHIPTTITIPCVFQNKHDLFFFFRCGHFHCFVSLKNTDISALKRQRTRNTTEISNDSTAGIVYFLAER